MKLVKFTNSYNNKPLYLNILQIGSVGETENGGSVIAATTHRNGGYEVNECVDYVVNEIEKALKNNQ